MKRGSLLGDEPEKGRALETTPATTESEGRERMRKILGVDPGGDVLLHVGKRADEAAKALGAEAFTLGGNDIFFGMGHTGLELLQGSSARP